MKLPYTGCNPRGMMISRDKALSKQILSYHRIPTPGFAVFRRGQRYRAAAQAQVPAVREVGDRGRLARHLAGLGRRATPSKLKERIEFIHEQTNSDALVEEYIEGRELYVGVLGNDRLRTFPVWEMDFGTLPDVMAGIATRKVKWDRRYQKKHGIRTGAAQALPDGCAAYLDKLSKRIYRALYTERLRAHGFPHAPRRQRVRARSERESEHQPRGGLRRLGEGRRRGLRRRCSSRSSGSGTTTRRRGAWTRREESASRDLALSRRRSSRLQPDSASQARQPSQSTTSCCPVDIRCRDVLARRQQEHRRVGNFPAVPCRPSGTAVVARDGRPRLATRPSGVSIRPGHDEIRADAVTRAFERDMPAQTGEPGFRGVIRRNARARLDRGDRAHEHERGARLQPWQRGARDQEMRAQIDRERQIPARSHRSLPGRVRSRCRR